MLQKDGYGKIVGRLKDIIIRGGENVFPKEIENFLNEHPDVIESHVRIFVFTYIYYKYKIFYLKNNKINNYFI